MNIYNIEGYLPDTEPAGQSVHVSDNTTDKLIQDIIDKQVDAIMSALPPATQTRETREAIKNQLLNMPVTLPAKVTAFPASIPNNTTPPVPPTTTSTGTGAPAAPSSGHYSAHNQTSVLRNLTYAYINSNQPLPEPDIVTDQLLLMIHQEYDLENSILPKSEKWRMPKELPAACVASLLNSSGLFARIVTDPNEDPQLFLYHTTGFHAGTYRYIDIKSTTGGFNNLVRQYNYTAKLNYRKEVLFYLADEAPILQLTTDDKWVAVDNGAFNVATKEFFSNINPSYRERFVYKMKVHTAYNPNASKNPTIINPETGDSYTVDDILDSYFGKDTPMTQLLWETIHAFVRYNKNYKVSHFWANVDSNNNFGSNGKSTLLSLLRSLLGVSTFTSVRPTEIGKRFALGSIHDCFAILCDEISVQDPIPADILKILCTRDESITTEKKFADSRSGKWTGNLCFCSNGFPKFLEHSGALEKRIYIWNFTKIFYEKTDDTFIMDEFVKDPHVLEYILYRVLHMGNLQRLSRPQEINDNLWQYRNDNCNTVHEFLNDFALPDSSGQIKLKWSMQPFKWLFAFYQAWLFKDLGKHNQFTPKKFRQEVVSWAANHKDIWDVNTGDVHRPNGVMEETEPLINAYLVNGYTPGYAPQCCLPSGNYVNHPLVDTYTGALIRK